MKTNIITNNTIMKTYVKYLCAVLLLLIGTSARVWGTMYTDTSLSAEVELEDGEAYGTFDFVLKNSYPGYTLVSGTNDYGYIVSELDDYDYTHAMFSDYTSDNPDHWDQQYGTKTMSVGYYFDAPGDYSVTLIVKHQQWANGGTVYDSQSFTIEFTVTSPCTKLGTASSLAVDTRYVNSGTTYVKLSWTRGTNVADHATYQKFCYWPKDGDKTCTSTLATSKTNGGITRSSLSTGQYGWSIQALGDGSSYCDSDEAEGEFCIDDVDEATPGGSDKKSWSGSTLSLTSKRIGWTAISNAEYYIVNIINKSTSATVGTANRKITTNSIDITGLTANVTYTISVVAYNACDDASNTGSVDFGITAYTVTFNLNGEGSSAPSSQTVVKNGKASTPSDPTPPTGKHFDGWYREAGCTNAWNFSTDVVTKDTTLYAKWTINTHSLHWYKNADDADDLTGTYTDGDAIAYGTTVTKPNNPTRTGYTFAGWSETSSGSTTTPVTTMPDADKAYYAIWTANEYSVHFDANDDDAEGSMDDQDFIYGVAQALTSCGFTKEGYFFKGWATSDDGDVVYTNGQSVSNLSSTDDDVVDLFAVWGTYEKYVFACVDISVSLEDSKKVLITSRNGVNIMAVNKLLVTTDGAVDGHTVDISSTDGLKFYKKVDGVYKDLSVAGNKLTTPLTNQAVYVSYNPTSAGTGAITAPTFTVKCEGQSQTFNTSGEYVKVRNLPDAVAIAAKIGGTWHALSADITSSSTPKDISIYTSTVDGVLKAYGDVTGLGYKLWPVLTVNSTNDRWGNATSYTPAKLYGDRLRFAGKDNKGLVANNNPSSNQYNINNSGAIAAITASFEHDENYEWKVTTTEVDGQFVYKLQTDQTNNTRYLRLYNGRWGTYLDGKGVDDLYLLPLVSANLVEMNAYEWGSTEVAVTYTPSATPVALTSVTIGNDDPISSGTASMTNVGGDIWKISGLSDLTAKPAQQFVVQLTENGASKQALLQVPFIVTSAKTEQNLRQSVSNDSKIYGNVDVVIRNGGKLTTEYNSGNFANLLIYPGGEAVVSNNMSFNNIYMRGGYSVLDGKTTYRYPDLCVKSGTITTEGVTYDMFIDNRLYYKFSMPSNVTLASVTDETGSEDFHVWVKHYDGAKRATGAHVNGWEWYGDEVGQESFKAGVGYEITAKPRVSGRPLAIIRFPVKSGNITSDANDTARVAVTNYGKSAYDSGDLAANNVGWNFVGNPYLTAFKATSDTSMIIDKSYEPADVADGESWDGTYKWVSSPARFITVPYDMMNDYHHEYVKNCTIPAFSAFFIQVVESGTFRMAGTRTEAAAPWRYSAAQKEKAEMHVDVLLRGKNEAVEAKAGLIIHDKYEGALKDFEDVEQWFVDQNEQKTYTFANGTALAYNLLNEQTAEQIIPMGYIATAAGEHTYSLDESNDVSGLEHLWLTDYVTGVTTDLLVHGYTFTTEAGRYDERFAISAVFNREEVVTDIAGTGDDDWTKAIGVYHDGNTLTLRGLPEGSSAYVYDMTGKLIASGQHLHNVASFNIAAQGVYNIRVVDGEKAVTLRSVLH